MSNECELCVYMTHCALLSYYLCWCDVENNHNVFMLYGTCIVVLVIVQGKCIKRVQSPVHKYN